MQRRRLFALVALSCAFAAALAANPGPSDDVPLLLPLPGLDRPTPIELEPGETGPQLRGCSTRPLAPVHDALPFGPGELLSYDVTLLGIRTGKVNLKVGERAVVDGISTYPLQAQARTDGFLQALGNFDARMVSFFDPATLMPVRMVNRVVTTQPFKDKPTISREDGAFAPAVIGPDGPNGGGVNARLKRSGPEGNIDKKARLKSSADVVDLLSMVYYLRSRTLPAGAPFCFELYHRRRLWRVEGRVGDVELVRSPYGAHRARRLDASVAASTRSAKPGETRAEPRKVTAWLTDDADRFPLLVSTPDKVGNLELRLLSAARGRRLVEK